MSDDARTPEGKALMAELDALLAKRDALAAEVEQLRERNRRLDALLALHHDPRYCTICLTTFSRDLAAPGAAE